MTDMNDESEGEWEEWTEEEDESDNVKSLFEDRFLATAEQAIKYDAEQHNFDLNAFKKQAGLDEYGVIKLINYIRSEVKAGRDPLPQLADSSVPKPWLGDAYLQPVLVDDGLLFHDFEDDVMTEGQASGHGAAALEGEVARLQTANAELHQMVQELLAVALPPDLQAERAAAQSQQGSSGFTAPNYASGAEYMPSTSGGLNTEPFKPRHSFGGSHSVGAGGPGGSDKDRVDSAYFDSYSYLDIHRDMLSDKVRTDAYRDALEQNPGLLQEATVLDVGCGTGILSMFAARGGAKRVFGVEGSEKMASIAIEIIELNKLNTNAEGQPLVSVLSGKLEELSEEDKATLSSDGGADVLVSEWMGYALLFETMLETVLYARDRYLKPGGAMLPDKAVLFLAGADERVTGLHFWQDVYGFNMDVVAEHIRAADVRKADVAVVDPSHIITETAQIQEFDLCTMSAEDQDFSVKFTLTPKAGSSAVHSCHALVLWFTTEFTERFCKEKPVVMSTSPFEPKTHWAQSIFPLPVPVLLALQGAPDSSAGFATEVKGRFSMARSAVHRSLDISIEYKAQLSNGVLVDEICAYGMNVIH